MDEDPHPMYESRFIARLAIWQMPKGEKDAFEQTNGLAERYECQSGLYVRGVCILSMKDLPFLTAPLRSHLFVNKFYWDFEPLALDCLEYWLRNRTLWQYQTYGTPEFDNLVNLTYYENLPYVKHHVPCNI